MAAASPALVKNVASACCLLLGLGTGFSLSTCCFVFSPASCPPVAASEAHYGTGESLLPLQCWQEE